MNQLLQLAKDEVIPAWRATYIGLLGNYVPHEAVKAYCQSQLKHEDPLVRGRATQVLGRFPDGSRQVIDSLKDESRTVRISAAQGITANNAAIPEGRAATEFEQYLQFNADRPQSLLMLSLEAAREGEIAMVKKYVSRAIKLDQANAEVYNQGAILLNSAGLNEDAKATLKAGWAIAPRNPQLPYSLGLLAAEEGDLNKAAGYLEETVALAPDFYRAWYNLSLAYSKLNRPEDAARAMQKAQGH